MILQLNNALLFNYFNMEKKTHKHFQKNVENFSSGVFKTRKYILRIYIIPIMLAWESRVPQ